jgi:hypothetical protein
MNGLLEGGAPGVVGTTVAALVTLAVWSYLAGERRLFSWAQYLLAGLATGYLLVLSVREVLVPQLVSPLLADPGRLELWPALAGVAVLAVARWLPRGIGALPIAFLVAATAAFALGGAVVGTLLPQTASALLDDGQSVGALANGLIGLVISLLVLVVFLHGSPRGRLVAGAAGVGRWLLLGGIGGWIGFLLVSRLALLVDRLRFLLVDWLGLGR